MLSRALMRGDYVAQEHVEWVEKDIQSLVGKYSLKEEKIKVLKNLFSKSRRAYKIFSCTSNKKLKRLKNSLLISLNQQ